MYVLFRDVSFLNITKKGKLTVQESMLILSILIDSKGVHFSQVLSNGPQHDKKNLLQHYPHRKIQMLMVEIAGIKTTMQLLVGIGCRNREFGFV